MIGSYVPSGLITLHATIADSVIDAHGLNTTLIYLKQVEDTSLSIDTIGNKPANSWVTGGRVPSRESNRYSVEKSYKTNKITKDVKQLIFWSPSKEWLNINDLSTFNFPGDFIETRTKIENFQDIMTCDYMVIDEDFKGYGTYEYELNGKPVPHGLGNRNNEMLCLWKRKSS